MYDFFTWKSIKIVVDLSNLLNIIEQDQQIELLKSGRSKTLLCHDQIPDKALFSLSVSFYLFTLFAQAPPMHKRRGGAVLSQISFHVFTIHFPQHRGTD